MLFKGYAHCVKDITDPTKAYVMTRDITKENLGVMQLIHLQFRTIEVAKFPEIPNRGTKLNYFGNTRH